MDKTIKVDEATYKSLNRIVGELRSKEGRPVSMNEALKRLVKEKGAGKRSIMDFAGSWKMSDREAKKMKKGLKKAWATWKPKSF